MHLVVNGRFLNHPVTGVQRYARELLAALDRHLKDWPGWSIEILAPRLLAPAPIFRNIALRSVGRLNGHAWEQFELPRHARGDVLFCPANTAPVVSLLASRPVVVTVHDLSYLYFPHAYTWAFRLAYHAIMPAIMYRATGIITVSTAEQVQILKHYPAAAGRLRAIQNGGSPDITGIDEPAVEALRPYVLYVGSFSKRKNFPAVLAVARRLLAERSDLRFVFVGGSPAVFNAVDLGLSDRHERMIFAGQLDDPARLMPYYRTAEVFLFPSLYEASPLPPIEAMASGCPVVASNIPALVERCGEAAVYCDPHCPSDIYDAVVRLLGDSNLRAELAQKGRERAGLFTWERCASSTMECIAEASSHKGRSGRPALRRQA